MTTDYMLKVGILLMTFFSGIIIQDDQRHCGNSNAPRYLSKIFFQPSIFDIFHLFGYLFAAFLAILVDKGFVADQVISQLLGEILTIQSEFCCQILLFC